MSSINKTEREAVLQKVVADGDLSKLNDREKWVYYVMTCESAGLDPASTPFSYMKLQGKLTLYAPKKCTDMLVAANKLAVEIVDRKVLESLKIFEVHAKVVFPDGRHVEDFAAVPLAGLQGEALANAMMKGVTKAKRRTVLSACGLGMLDETEVETIPGAVVTAATVPVGDGAAASSSTSSGLCTKDQADQIRAEFQRLGVGNAAARDELVKRYNKMSLPELAQAEAVEWLAELKKRQPGAATPPPVEASNKTTGEIAMVDNNQKARIAILWKAKFIDEDNARAHMVDLLGKMSRKDLTYQEADFLCNELDKMPDYKHDPEPLPGTVETPAAAQGQLPGIADGPASKEQLDDCMHHIKRAFGDPQTDQAARDAAQAHMRAWTGKAATKELTMADAAKWLGELIKLPDQGEGKDPIPF